MQAYEFHYGPKLIAGQGAAARLAELLPAGPCLFVTDANVRALGLAEAVLAALAAQGRSRRVRRGRAGSVARDADGRGRGGGGGCASVVGFGGGSPMDVAKLAAYLIATGEDLDTLWGVGKATGQKLPLALVPTTAGTGSEATAVTVITVGGSEKRGVNSPALYADWAVLDAELTLTLPRHVTAATGIDAMVHAIEAYTSARLKNPMSDMFARKAMRLISDNLLRACDAPDDRGGAGQDAARRPSRRRRLRQCAGGGRACARLSARRPFPCAARPLQRADADPCARPQYGGGAAALCRARRDARSDGQGYRPAGPGAGLRPASRPAVARRGVPQRLCEVGIGPEHLDLLASEAMKQERLLINNPCPISEADARRLYEAAL